MKKTDILESPIPSFVGYLLMPVYVVGLFATTTFLIFAAVLMWIRKQVGGFSNPPFFIQRQIFAQKEKPIVSNSSWKQMKQKKHAVYIKLNEGFGGAYERIAYTNVLKHLLDTYGGKKILELNSTFIAGVPAFNSSLLVTAGYDVTVTVHRRDYPDAVLAWKLAGLYDKVRIMVWDDDTKTPFRRGSFDLVWNHLAVEHYDNPVPFINEMRRISRNLVVTMTLSPWNVGFILHWFWHKMTGKYWDHGIIRNTMISTMEKLHKKSGLSVVESGGCDDPIHMDTVDARMGESMTYLDALPEGVRGAWIWTAINPVCQRHPLVTVNYWLERSYPEWFRRFTAHHLYTASIKR